MSDPTVSGPTTEPEVPAGEDRILTVPNIIPLVRLACLPVFLYLLFGRDNPAGAAWLLGGLGATDWVDGWLARRYNQVSEFGKVFDPTADRILFMVAIVAIMIDGSMPVWFGVAVLAREVLVGLMMVVATLVFKMERIDVTWLGKCATFLLMFAVPGFLMANSDFPGADWFGFAAWCLGIPGLVLSYYTGLAYIPEVRRGIARHRAAVAASVVPSTS